MIGSILPLDDDPTPILIILGLISFTITVFIIVYFFKLCNNVKKILLELQEIRNKEAQKKEG